MKIAAIAITLILTVGLLAGCGGGSAKAYDPEAIASEILAKVEFESPLTRAEGAALDNIYALGDAVSSHAVYYDASSFTAGEVAVLTAKSAGDIQKLKAVLEARVENLALMYANYNPKEMDKINSPVIVTKENIAVLVLANDSAGAKNIVEALLS